MDTRNTRSQLDAALKKVFRRPAAVAQLAQHIHDVGTRDGFDNAVLAACDAVLAEASLKLNESDDAARRGDDPRAGDLEVEANYLFGIYEQLSAAFMVARASRP